MTVLAAARFLAMVDTIDGILSWVLLWLAVWGVSAVAVALVAHERELSVPTYAIITPLFLGPLGPRFALIAPHGRIEKSQLAAITARK